MSDGLAKAALAAYRLAGALAYPALGPYVKYRIARGKEDPTRRSERHGIATAERPQDGPLVWMHAASVGESTAVAGLARSINADAINVLMTTGTMTSAKLVADRLSDCVIHQYVPIDMQRCIGRFLDHWRPDVAIVAESEIWPITMQELTRREIPQVLVNARLSDRSYKGWKSVPRLAETLFERLSLVVAQSDVDAERFHHLGAQAVTVAGNLKADTPPPRDPGPALLEIAEALGERPRWAALSTHPGEEKLVATVHRRLSATHPGLLTIVVPRHVDRATEIEAQLMRDGLRVARRSRGDRIEASTDILLGDTMGEMGLYLRLCEIAFLGKSITGEGGQNPLEAAMLGKAIVSGRYVQNFRDAYRRLIRGGGTRIVSDAESLGQCIDGLLGEPGLRAEMAEANLATLNDMRGALPRTLQALQPFLNPLRLSIGLDRTAREPAVR